MLSSSKYVVLLDFIPADQFRYKFEYESTSWMVACEEGTPTPSQIYTHPFSPQFGFEWCRAEMSFIKCKLTNNYRENCGHVSFLNFFFFDIIISGEMDSTRYKFLLLTQLYKERPLAVNDFLARIIPRMYFCKSWFLSISISIQGNFEEKDELF